MAAAASPNGQPQLTNEERGTSPKAGAAAWGGNVIFLRART